LLRKLLDRRWGSLRSYLDRRWGSRSTGG